MKKLLISVMDTLFTILAALIIVVFFVTGTAFPGGAVIGGILGGSIGIVVAGTLFGFWMLLSSIHDQLVLLVKKNG